MVRNLRDYLNTFGARSGGANMYDAAETFFNCGGGRTGRAAGVRPTAVNATIGLDSSKIVVTSGHRALLQRLDGRLRPATVTLTLVREAAP